MGRWDVEDQRNVLGVIDFVEQGFLVCIDIHADCEQIVRLTGHEVLSIEGYRFGPGETSRW